MKLQNKILTAFSILVFAFLIYSRQSNQNISEVKTDINTSKTSIADNLVDKDASVVYAKEEEKQKTIAETTLETEKETVTETVEETTIETEETFEETEKELLSIEEVSELVLSGAYGTGESRREQLQSEGYDYDEVAKQVDKIIAERTPKPVVEEKIVSSSETEAPSTNYNEDDDEEDTAVVYAEPVSSNNSLDMAPYSVYIAGNYFTITNDNTQERLDARRKEFVSWHSMYDGAEFSTEKANADGGSIYLAIHRGSWGLEIMNSSSLVFSDINGNQQEYVLVNQTGTIYYSDSEEEIYDTINSFVSGKANRVYIQTCMDSLGVSYQIWEYAPVD